VTPITQGFGFEDRCRFTAGSTYFGGNIGFCLISSFWWWIVMPGLPIQPGRCTFDVGVAPHPVGVDPSAFNHLMHIFLSHPLIECFHRFSFVRSGAPAESPNFCKTFLLVLRPAFDDLLCRFLSWHSSVRALVPRSFCAGTAKPNIGRRCTRPVPTCPFTNWHKTRLSPARRAGYTVGSFAIKVGNSPAPSIYRVADAP